MLKSKTITIETGRDKGKSFVITEMPAAQADNWAMRCLLALAGGGVEVEDAQSGMLGMARVALSALGRIPPEVSLPLLDELLGCVQTVLTDGSRRPLDVSLNDVEDFTTLFRLRKEVFQLHIDFLLPALGLTSASAAEGTQAQNM